MPEFLIDLHLHTCLSPCGDLRMSPGNIVGRAKTLGIAMIAICDHNATENVEAVANIGLKNGITVLSGMEITTREEVHILGWFPNLDTMNEVQKVIYQNLPGQNDPDRFGLQPIVDEEGYVVGFNSHLLIGATTLALEDVVSLIHHYKGLAVAAHIDRPGFGIINQLGFIPPQLELDALEVSCHMSIEEAATLFPEINHYPLITSSDAHCLDDIGRGAMKVQLPEVSFEALAQWLHSQRQREG